MNIDVRILQALRAAGQGAVSGAELSQELGVSRTAVWARIRELRSLGYDIAASPHQGYRLVASPDLLHADDLLARLGQPAVIGREVRVFQETTSTNDVVEKLARDGVKEGTVVFAEEQTRGRGRLGRRWASPPGKGLWFSVLLRPELSPAETTQVTVIAATAVRRAIASFAGLQVQIKWPNDILVHGKKIAGILTELRAELDAVKYIILGVGVDVNLNLGDLPAEARMTASSLKMELDKTVSRPDLAVAILRELDRDYTRLRAKEFAALSNEWEQHCATLGRDVAIRVGKREFRGRAESLGESGELLLRTEHGHLERIVGGDLTQEG
jgi:BirA family transcriptional regulator, biotin operon repressor / biotin---[acetyl-CoA-carboxylase] ligase